MEDVGDGGVLDDGPSASEQDLGEQLFEDLDDDKSKDAPV
jgi:hypothetical protein